MKIPPQATLVLAAQAGDQTAFETLAKVYRREPLVYCYRMLGSFNDAEDLVQETLLRAWEKRVTLTSPGSYRAWLYRIATNLCLDRLRSAPRRALPPQTHPMDDPSNPSASTPVREPIWLVPFPDDLLADHQTDPEVQAERSEQTTLAFLMALQYLTPAQRAILLLRDVLEWEAREEASWLNPSVAAVNSGLQRARRALEQRPLHSEQEMPPLTPTEFLVLWNRVGYRSGFDIGMYVVQRRAGKRFCSRKWSLASSKHIPFRHLPHPPPRRRRTSRVSPSESSKSWLPLHEGNAVRRLRHIWD